jgi:hypothetical protein
MHRLILAMICSVTLAEYLTRIAILPRPAKFLPELFSAIVAAYVLGAGVRQRFQFVRATYWLAFGSIAVTMVCGALANTVATGPLIAGIRTYLAPIPLFFLPAVFDFKEQQIRKQLLVLLGITLVQLPIAIHQRWVVMREHRWTGDEVSGTLLISSNLSIFLISCVCVLTGLFLRGRLSKPAFLALFFTLLIPTTINETKGTLLLLPLGLLITLVAGSQPGRRLRLIGLATVLLVAFGAIFIPVYDAMRKYQPYYTPITGWITDQEKVERYLNKDSAVGDTGRVGRWDALVVPLHELSRDPVNLVFGLGLGNASHSNLGEQFVGKYYHRLGPFTTTSASTFALELGLLSTTLVFLILFLVFRDSLAVARVDKCLTGAIAIGWCGVSAVITLATFYKAIHTFESLSYLFWYFSGLLAAARMRLARRSRL